MSRDDLNKSLVKVEGLTKFFRLKDGSRLHAVEDVSFEIARGEVLGLAGESGCGKSTCGRCLLGLEKLISGTVEFAGADVSRMGRSDLQRFRKEAQMVFQDPFASLDPRMTVADIVAEGIDAHHLARDKAERTELIYRYLRLVGLTEEQASRFPHEFSGGQRQRIGIARAMAVEPSFLVLDEPISALDVSIQAQVVNLLADLRELKGLSMLFISHDLSMLRYISDRIAVMYLGKLVEIGPAAEVCEHPAHPYTRALLSSVPIPDPAAEARRVAGGLDAQGEVPTPVDPEPGCRFRGRCPFASGRCAECDMGLAEVGPGHLCACPYAAGE